MTLQDLIDHVEQPLFEQAQEWARETAEGIGTRDMDGKPDIFEFELQWSEEARDVPRRLERMVWSQGDATGAERVALAFELYRAMPCYMTC